MSIEAMKQALEAMGLMGADLICEAAHHGKKDRHGIGEPCHIQQRWHKAFDALRTAIAEAEKQEPVACIIDGDLYYHHEIDWEDLAYQGNGVELLYTTPPAAQRQPLTDEQIGQIIAQCKITLVNYCSDEKQKEFARAIEAKLKEKNT